MPDGDEFTHEYTPNGFHRLILIHGTTDKKFGNWAGYTFLAEIEVEGKYWFCATPYWEGMFNPDKPFQPTYFEGTTYLLGV
jgi:hypothetical protein